MSEPTSDRDLFARFVAGDEQGLAMLAERYEMPMIGLARGLLGGREELARDAVQDTWLRVIRAAHTYNAQASVKTWLYRILINRCHDLRSSPKNAPAREPADVAGPERRPPSEERDPALSRALESLPEDRRTILVLCYHRGMTHEHAASVLGIPLGTLKSRLNAALNELRSNLASDQSRNRHAHQHS